MCGFAGFCGSGAPSDLERMIEKLFLRGPDEGGNHIDSKESVFLGFRRLAIIDIVDGQQPMFNEDGHICVVFNGEIYNHLDLRKKLEHAGHHFKTDHSDTEVLVHGYEEWGNKLPEKLNGMFAFAICDKHKKTIFLARDRFGEKPLYYSKHTSGFIFGSQPDALAEHPSFNRNWSRLGLQKFFAHGFFPSPYTHFENCKKLQPGSFLTYRWTDNSILQIKNYYEFRIQTDQSLCHADENDLCEELRSLLTQSVKRRLMSDVPLGVFLSGGIDSTSVCAAATELSPNVSTFSIGFDEPSFDESSQAAAAASFYKTTHTSQQFHFAPSAEQLLKTLKGFGEPIGDPSILPTFDLCTLARKKVKVALSGDGADELFAGYDPFIALYPAQIYNLVVPHICDTILRKIVSTFPISKKYMGMDFRAKRFLNAMRQPSVLWNPLWLAPLQPPQIRELFGQPVSIEELYSEIIDYASRSQVENHTDQALEFYTRFYLTDGILTKVDRASMQASLEVRSVFLDNDLTDFAARLPAKFKLRNFKRKYLLKKAMRGILPAETLHRKKKGFGIPVHSWIKTANWPELNLPYIDNQIARKWIHKHQNGQADERLFGWNLLASYANHS